MTQKMWKKPEMIELGKAEVLTKAFSGGGDIDQDCLYRSRTPWDN